MRRRAVLLALAVLAFPSLAQEPKGSGARQEMLDELRGAAKETIALAEAMPAEKYSWRPAPGVRSVSEAYMHIAAGIHLLTNMAGVNPDKRYSRDSEKTVTEKARVVEALKSSFALAEEKLSKATDAELDKGAKFFGRDTTVRALYLRLLVHCWEHLGQSVAYARTNGVKPPWSE